MSNVPNLNVLKGNHQSVNAKFGCLIRKFSVLMSTFNTGLFNTIKISCQYVRINVPTHKVLSHVKCHGFQCS